MISISHFALCSDVLIDKNTNEASYIRIIEEFSSESVPFVAQKFFVCAIIDSKEAVSSIDIKITVNNPSKVQETLGAFSISQEVSRAKIQIAIEKAPFSQFGRHEVAFTAQYKGKVLGESIIPLYIRKKSH